MTRAQRILLTFTVALACVGCDQAAKSLAQRTLPVSPPVVLFGDIFHFQYAENDGALLGFGSELSKETRFWLFIVFACSALALVLGFTITNGNLDVPAVFSLSLVLGGGLSNVIDRIARGGVVIDFVMIVAGPLRTAIFNLADLAILIGVVGLVLSRVPALLPSSKVAP